MAEYIYPSVNSTNIIANTDIKKLVLEAFKRVHIYIHSDKTIIESINKIVKNKKIDSDPYYYCNKDLIKKIEEQIKSFEKIKTADEEECCICLDKCQYNERSYFVCKHFVCNVCYGTSEFNSPHSKCPICRTVVQQIIFSDKYAIICTGIATKLYTFENGGYKSMCIAYFPDFNGEGSTMFNNITYYDENKNKYDFVQRVYDLLNNDYIVILQNHNEVKRWMNEIMLKDLVNDKRLIYEQHFTNH